jgi:hypothetical protein
MGRSSSISLVSALLALGACAAQTESVERPVGIDPGVGLRESTEEPGAWTYRAPEVDLASFRRFILDIAASLSGRGRELRRLVGGAGSGDRPAVQRGHARGLGTKYPVVSKPGPGVARLRFTIMGVSETVPYVSTVTRVIPIGAAINLLSQGTGHGGTLTGSVTYGIEAFDSQSGKLVAAAVRRLTPGAFDISSTLGTMDTARAVARDAAAKLRATLDSLHG